VIPAKRRPDAIIFPSDSKSRAVYFHGCLGFGDNFFQRPVVRHLERIFKEVFVRTALPEAYWDIPRLRFVRPEPLNLRTQRKHLDGFHKDTFVIQPEGAFFLNWSSLAPLYNKRPGGAIEQIGFESELSNFEYVQRRAGIRDADFFFPLKESWLSEARRTLAALDLKGKPLCLLHPPTVRKEWRAESRNPKIEYFNLLIEHHRSEYFFLSLADLEAGEEWLDGELSDVNKTFHRGELPLTTIFGLMKLADMTIAPPGLFAAAAAAIKAKCLCVFGGMQKPSLLFGPSMGLENFEYAARTPFCNCFDMLHKCDKNMPEEKILAKFKLLRARPKSLRKVSVGVPPGIGDMHWVLTKMESFKERLGIAHLTIAVHEDRGHAHNGQFLELVPFIDSIERRPVPFRFSLALCGGHGKPLYQRQQGADYMMEFNSELESGKRLDDILPEFETNWNYEIKYPSESREFAQRIKKSAGGKMILLYASSDGGNGKWAKSDWTALDWMELTERLLAAGHKPILIGADWDRGYSSNFKEFVDSGKLVSLVGETTVSQVLALLREADVFVSYLSGLAVMAVHFGTPCAVFWPIKGVSEGGEFKREFMASWLPPWARDMRTYMPLVYGETKPEHVFERIREFL